MNKRYIAKRTWTIIESRKRLSCREIL